MREPRRNDRAGDPLSGAQHRCVTRRRRWHGARGAVLLLACAWRVASAAGDNGNGNDVGARCAAENDDRLRLACYDRAFRPAPAGAPTVPSSTRTDPSGAVPAYSLLSRFWELDEDDKRPTYIVKTYLPNYLLGLHYTSAINRYPRSPTQTAGAAFADYGPLEAKLQLSLRAKVARNVLVEGADVWFAYTQQSLAQPWNREDSAPFRTTDHQPEAIWVLPVASRAQALGAGWQWKMVQLGIAHESNGLSDPLSRSWNRVYVAAAVEHDDLSLLLRLNQRVLRDGPGDNPDLTDYIGRADLVANWMPGLATAMLTWRATFHSLARGSLQLDLTYPFNGAQPAGLRWQLQLFHGYGETLIDYNHRQSRVGLGVSLFQF